MSKLVISAVVASHTLSCGLLLGILAISSFAAVELPYTPPPFACELRYHFREHLRAAKVGEKSVSAPSYEREA